MTNLQIRSVDEALAAAAKARAAASHRSLSDYVKSLIEQDLAAQDEAISWQILVAEISADRTRTPVTPSERADALRAARGQLSLR